MQFVVYSLRVEIVHPVLVQQISTEFHIFETLFNVS